MNRTGTVRFHELRHLLEDLEYEYRRTDEAEVFRLSRDRMIYFGRYGDREFVRSRDLASTRNSLDAWGQLDASKFDAFLKWTTKPA